LGKLITRSIHYISKQENSGFFTAGSKSDCSVKRGRE
jgi:hypothetical protein